MLPRAVLDEEWRRPRSFQRLLDNLENATGFQIKDMEHDELTLDHVTWMANCPTSFHRPIGEAAMDEIIVAARWMDATGEDYVSAEPDVFLAFYAILEAGDVAAAYRFAGGVAERDIELGER